MTQKEAREIIMQATHDAMQTWERLSDVNKNNLDNRLDFINHFVNSTVPAEIRKLAA